MFSDATVDCNSGQRFSTRMLLTECCMQLAELSMWHYMNQFTGSRAVCTLPAPTIHVALMESLTTVRVSLSSRQSVQPHLPLPVQHAACSMQQQYLRTPLPPQPWQTQESTKMYCIRWHCTHSAVTIQQFLHECRAPSAKQTTRCCSKRLCGGGLLAFNRRAS
jgi:hypothetical protein